MTIEFKIYCGLDTNGHEEVGSRAIVEKLALKYFPDGHTISEELGRWARRDHYGPTSDVITEQTLVVTWICSDVQNTDGKAERLVGRFAGAYKAKAFQESVMITRRDLDCFYV